MMNIDSIERKLEFLKKALNGGDIILSINDCNNEQLEKIEQGNIQIQEDIDKLERRRINIIRKQKIKKITDE